MAADERDPKSVVVADHEGVLVTRDGGCTWRRAVRYADFTTGPGIPLDAAVAGTGATRSLHVLLSSSPGYEIPKLLSSFDDGATWEAVDVPPVAALQPSIEAGPSTPGVVYLLSRHAGATGAIYAGSGRDDWRWQSVTAGHADAAWGACIDAVTCASPPLAAMAADPRRGGGVWGHQTQGVLRSADEGATWVSYDVPELTGDIDLMDVGPRHVMILSDFWEFAVSRDGGRTWSVGDFPKLTSADWESVGVFDVAHFDRGRAVAALPGDGPSSPWAGNVQVFDGRRWRDAAPPGSAGYEPTDEDGNPLALTALTSTDGPLLALSSRGELMTFRRR